MTSFAACSDRSPQASSGDPSVRPEQVDLSPAAWRAGELARFRELQMTFGEAQQLVESDESMIAGITAALAVRAGQEALNQGGSAADGAMATTLAEIVLTAGSSVTLAGEMVMLYYEAASDQVHSMSATYNSVLGEDDPASIPPQGTPSGRATLVPGVMAGIGAAHERFGRLPWASIVEPAIYFAEEGFEIDAVRERVIDQRFEVITRYPEGRAIFLKEDGTPYREGDWFRQPAMASTLRRVADEGPDYFYRGEWGEHLVEAVQALDGRMTLEDLHAYEPIWSDPVSTSFRGYDVYGAGLPSYGGVNTIEALNVFEAAGGSDLGRPDQEPVALLRLMQIAQLADNLSPPLIGGFPPSDVLASWMPHVDLSAEGRSRKSTARAIWLLMREAAWAEFQRAVADARAGDSDAVENLTSGFGRRRPSADTVGAAPPRHTAGVVVFDAYGDVAVVLHSINSSLWGDTGLFVDGVSIPDAGAFQQELIAAVGPGARLPEWDTPTIVLRDGVPYLGAVSIGAAYHEVNVQNLIHVLAFDMDPGTALDQPQLRKKWPYDQPLRQPTGDGQFERRHLESVRRLGMDLEVVESAADAGFGGYWLGVRRSALTGRLQGARSRPQNGYVIGN